MNNENSGGVQNMWFSVRRGGVHFVHLNTETDWEGAEESTTGDGHFPFLPAGGFGRAGEYLQWLAADLQRAASDPSVRWIIASGHRPFEDLPSTHSTALSQLFLEAGVAFYFCGHGHTYIRYNSTAFGSGAVQVMAGASGSDETPWPKSQAWAGEGHASTRAAQRCQEWCAASDAADLAAGGKGEGKGSACRFCRSPLGATPAAQTDLYSIGHLDVQRDALTFRLLRAPDGAVLDEVTVVHKSKM
jgi:hypothetical protein